MAGNSVFEMVSERGWRRGLGNLFNNELSRWWKTRMWWIQSLVWIGIVGFMMGVVLFGSKTPTPREEAAMLYSIFAGLFPAVGVVIIMQGAVVGEKKDGTAAWVLSKPLARPAFMLSKVVANSLGILATMVILPGTVAYIMQAVAATTSWNPLGFLAALGVIFVINFYFLSLALMLGTFFKSRGPVIGISLALLFLQQYLVGMVPALRYVLPWNLIIPMGQSVDAVVPCLLMGWRPYSTIPVIAVTLESILFILIALWRFNREEF